LVVIVFPVVVAFIVIAPVADHTVPATKNKDPLIEKEWVPICVMVTVPADTVRSKQAKDPVQNTVYVPA
jgi:hypothetical protein